MNVDEVDLKFNTYLQTFNDKLQKIKSGTQEESPELLSTLFEELYQTLSQRRKLPVNMELKKGEMPILQLFSNHMGLLLINTLVKYKQNSKKNIESNPSLVQSLELLLKYISFNTNLAEYLSLTKNLPLLKRMQLHTFCLDIENKTFKGEDGHRIQQLSF